MHVGLVTGWLALTLVTSDVSTVATTTGGSPPPCGELQDLCGWLLRGHTNPGPAASNYAYPHTACEDCIIDGEYYPGEYCHGPCVLPFYSFRDALRMAETDPIMLMYNAPLQMKYVGVNFARQSIQISDCSGAIIANIPLRMVYAQVERAAKTGGSDVGKSQSPDPMPYWKVALETLRAALNPWLV